MTLTNEKMKPGRYLRWHEARRKLSAIVAHLAAGNRVLVATYTRAVTYGPKHAEAFKATRTGLYVRRGRAWDCIDGCAIRLI